MERRFYYLLVCLIFASSSLYAEDHNSADQSQSGIFDLRDFDFSAREMADLSGLWYFLADSLAPFNSIAADTGDWQLLKVPHNWRNAEDNNAFGVGTYLLKLRSSDDDARPPILSLYIKAIYSACEIFIDGREYSRLGKVHNNPDSSIAKIRRQVISFPVQSDSSTILIRVANHFDLNIGGLNEQILLGSPRAIESFISKNDRRVLIISAILAALGFYHLFLFFLRQKQKLNLLLFLISILYIIKLLSEGDTLFQIIFPGISLSLIYRLWMLCMNTTMIFYLLVHLQFPKALPRLFVRFLFVCFAAYNLLVLFFPLSLGLRFLNISVVFSVALLFLLPFFMIQPIRHRESWAWLWLFSLIPVLAAVSSDMLYAISIISTPYFSHYLILASLLAFSIQFTIRFAHSYEQVIELSEEIRRINEGLEETVALRTDELRLSNEALQGAHKELLAELESKRWELVRSTLGLLHSEIARKNALQEIRKLIADENHDLTKLEAFSQQGMDEKSPFSWEEFEKRFAGLHSDFYEKLQNDFPNLSLNERKLCAFLRMDMNNKDISLLTFSSYEAVRKARHRLRKKLNLDDKTEISSFLRKY
jgi:hypothetical protein